MGAFWMGSADARGRPFLFFSVPLAHNRSRRCVLGPNRSRGPPQLKGMPRPLSIKCPATQLHMPEPLAAQFGPGLGPHRWPESGTSLH